MRKYFQRRLSANKSPPELIPRGRRQLSSYPSSHSIPFDATADALLRAGVPVILARDTGVWLTHREFRARPNSSLGAVCTKRFTPTKGAPQGGVHSPLLRFVRTNIVAAQARQRPRRIPPGANMETTSAIQIFANGVPTNVAHRGNKKLAQIARQLRQVLRTISAHLVLGEGLPKCNNFLVGGIREDIVE